MKSKKGKSYIWGNIYFGIIFFSCLSSSMSQISFNLFCSGDKKLLSEFLRKWVWFHEHNERFPNILAKNWNFKKLRHCFVDEIAMIITTLTISCYWKTLVPFCLRKKRPENAFLTQTVNYRKILQKTNYTIQNNSKLAIYWYMMLLSHWLFWLKNCPFSTNSCKGLLYP